MPSDKSESRKRPFYKKAAGALFIAAITAGIFALFTTLFPKTDQPLKGQPLRDFWKTIFTYNATRKDWMAAARVTLRDNQVYVGWPRYWSQSEHNNMLFLDPAYVLGTDGSCSKLKGPGVMLFEEEIKYIEFIRTPPGVERPCDFKVDKKNASRNR